ncbi:MAG: putative deacylase [Psychromonas sp.]|uniref:succinylglutamate desuccinylase/aspartoacylase domain-containing protein n=1 Tax=Psychromonas sp. TaxID=1884585 RepID=UPI0039E6C67E
MSTLISQSDCLNYFENPNPDDFGESVESFLHYLQKATAIFLSGQDSSKRRAVCTLLHGNEPSGTEAVFNYLKSKQKPRFDTLFIIGSVQAACVKPFFSQRMEVGKRDLNRCFRPPYDDSQGQIAKAILDLLKQVKPECLIDIHNTSGSGPSFGVAIAEDANHIAITSLFTNDLIVTDLRLGALMEQSEQNMITVTVECGGAQDKSSQIIAHEGLHRYLSAERVMAGVDDQYPINVFHNPIRLETKNHGEVAYAKAPCAAAVITLPEQAYKFNYGMLTKDEFIGYLNEDGFAQLTAIDHLGNERLDEFFEKREGKLFSRHPIKVFMMTTNPFIAKTDCLFYFIGNS